LPFAKGERKKIGSLPFRAIRISFVNRRLAAGRLEIDFKKPWQFLAKLPAEARAKAQNCPPKPEPKARARRNNPQIQFGGVYWTKKVRISSNKHHKIRLAGKAGPANCLYGIF
jgi:hypothetical protein